MSVIFMDGFDHYGGGEEQRNNMLAGAWAALDGGFKAYCGVPSFGPARTGPYCFVGADRLSSNEWSRRVLPASGTRFFVSFGFAVSAIPVDFVNGVFAVMDGSATVLYYLRVTPTGALSICEPDGTVIAQTSGPVITAATWHFIEMDINTAGNWTVRVDDVLASETPALIAPLSGGTIEQIGVFNWHTGSSGAGSTPYMDDLIVRDTAGGVNDTWMGDRRVATLFADADTADAGWTPSYYKDISPGIGRFAYMVPYTSTTQATQARVATAGATALDIGSNDFTLETFVRFDRLPVNTEYFTIFNRWNETSSTGRSFRLVYGGPGYNGGEIAFQTSTDGSGGTAATKLSFPWTPEADRWYHIALCRDSGELLLFIDGIQMGLPITDGDTYYASAVAAFAVGSYVPGSSATTAGTANTTLVGRLDETRFTNGVSRYNSNFTPTTTLFPRGSTDDPNWAQVVLLLGYDSGITDESSFARTLNTSFSVTSVLPVDGADVGAYSTVGEIKATPDDNTFIYASLVNATNVLTMTTNPTNATTVTVGTTDGSTPAVYTFVNTLATAFDVLIGATAQDTLTNLLSAINAGTGEGTTYGTGTTANNDVEATELVTGQIQVTALVAGTTGNSIASTSTSTASWASATLTGGSNIPGPTVFRFQRPPTNTTVISAVQINVRAQKTDSGLGSIQTGLVGPLGGVANGATHALTISPIYYADVIEEDPDTSGPLSPTTIINGGIRINRTA